MAVKAHSITEILTHSIYIAVVTIYSHWLGGIIRIAFLLNN